MQDIRKRFSEYTFTYSCVVRVTFSKVKVTRSLSLGFNSIDQRSILRAVNVAAYSHWPTETDS